MLGPMKRENVIFLTHMTVYWLSCLIFSGFDLYWIYTGNLERKFLGKKRMIPSPSKVAWAIAVSLANQALSYPVMIWFSHYSGSIQDDPLDWYQMILIGAFYLFMADQWFYWTHRLGHHPLIYQQIHSIHHQWVHPIAVRAIYAHPVEHLVVNIGSILIGPLIIPSHFSMILFWVALTTFNAVYGHSGTAIPAGSAEKHDLHHRFLNCNYGTLGLSDIMYGTEMKTTH